MAGSRGGTEKTPAWAWNLRGHDERGDTARVLDRGTEREVDVVELHGAERDDGYRGWCAPTAGSPSTRSTPTG